MLLHHPLPSTPPSGSIHILLSFSTIALIFFLILVHYCSCLLKLVYLCQNTNHECNYKSFIFYILDLKSDIENIHLYSSAFTRRLVHSTCISRAPIYLFGSSCVGLHQNFGRPNYASYILVYNHCMWAITINFQCFCVNKNVHCISSYRK